MELLILLLLIVLNGSFAMAEMAIVAARRTRLQQWADEGRPGAGLALALASDPGHFLSTTQIAITVISIVSGAFAGATVADQLAGTLAVYAPLRPHAGTLALIAVVTAISAGSLVLGELVPKRIALLNPEAIACAVARPMRLLSLATFPVVRAMSLATDAVLHLFGAKQLRPPPVSQEEVRALMRQGAAAGVFDSREQAMVARVFRMDERRITSVMTPRVDIRALDLGAGFAATRATIVASPHSRFPLCRGGLDEVVGVVHAKGLLEDALQGKPFDPQRHAVMPLFVPDGLTLAELLETFRRHGRQLALVVDEYGEIQGLVTMTDVMQALVGDFGTAEQPGDLDIVARPDGSWLVDGAVAVQRLKEVVGLESAQFAAESENYDTLGGFVMAQLHRMPRAGDQFAAGSQQFEVVDMDGHRVGKVLITPLSPVPRPPGRTAPRCDSEQTGGRRVP